MDGPSYRAGFEHPAEGAPVQVRVGDAHDHEGLSLNGVPGAPDGIFRTLRCWLSQEEVIWQSRLPGCLKTGQGNCCQNLQAAQRASTLLHHCPMDHAGHRVQYSLKSLRKARRVHNIAVLAQMLRSQPCHTSHERAWKGSQGNSIRPSRDC